MTDIQDLILQHYNIQAAIQRGQTSSWRWVLPKPTYDRLVEATRREAEASGHEWPGELASDLPVTLLGMPIRVDEHATTTMIELRTQDQSSSPGNPAPVPASR